MRRARPRRIGLSSSIIATLIGFFSLSSIDLSLVPLSIFLSLVIRTVVSLHDQNHCGMGPDVSEGVLSQRRKVSSRQSHTMIAPKCTAVSQKILALYFARYFVTKR